MLRIHCSSCCAGKLSEQAKDQVEEHVGLLVRTITQSLDALKNGVMAAQQPQEDGQPLINEQMAAHLHGAVGRPAASTGRPGPGQACKYLHSVWLGGAVQQGAAVAARDKASQGFAAQH